MSLTEDQAIQFRNQFPDAASFLTRCELENEFNHLSTTKCTLNDWQKKRLKELTWWNDTKIKFQEAAP